MVATSLYLLTYLK